MGNCLSTCAKRPGSSAQGLELTASTPAPANTAPALATLQENDEGVRRLVQQELQALQEQISRSQSVLAKLNICFNNSDWPPQHLTDLVKTHQSTQTSNPDTLPKSLECVPGGAAPDWRQITSSCPAIVNTAVQTDDDDRTCKSNNTSGEYFLPPISPHDSQPSEPVSPKDLGEISHKPSDSRAIGHIDLDIYRSCRKLSVLPEEELVAEEVSPPVHRLAPTPHYPHQAHSFESYLLPVPASPNSAVRRQLSDPTPSPDIHPASRRSSRSTCRPLQLQPDNYFRFPEVKIDIDEQSAAIPDDFPRITSPTYNILQDTVTQLITISSECLESSTENKTTSKKVSLMIPSNYYSPDDSSPYKTPPENSLISTPGFFTPQEICEKKSDSSTSSQFQTPTSISPESNGMMADCNKSTSNSSQSYKMVDETSNQSSYSSPIVMSPQMRKRRQTNGNNEIVFTEVSPGSEGCSNSKLYVKPLPGDFDPNLTMLSILLDGTQTQTNNSTVEPVLYSESFISFSSLDIEKTLTAPEQVPSSLTPLTPTVEGLSRTPSRRRLQRSLVRISSETPLEFVPISRDTGHSSTDAPSPSGPSAAAQPVLDVPSGSGCEGSGSAPFPSLSDTVLRQLGALMEETQNSEKETENKYTSLMLAFKTDKLTLERRLERQKRLRDQAERNMASELASLHAAVQLLSPLCTDSEKIELLENVSQQVDTLHKSTSRISTSAEMYGAVQQENRLSKAVDIVLRHVENLKQAYDKEKREHEETRKVLPDSKSHANAALKMQNAKRRASIATLTRAQPSFDPGRSPTLPSEGRSLSRARLGSLPRKLSNIILEAEQEELPPSPSQPQPATVDVVRACDCEAEAVKSSSCEVPADQSATTTSHGGDTESEEESLTQEPAAETTDLCPALLISHTTTHSNRHRPWELQWQWAPSPDQLVLHLRYSVAVALLLAALAVFTSTFILPHTSLA